MSPLGIKRAVAILLILSPWIFVPSILKDVVFIIAGVFLFISTLDLRKKTTNNHRNNEETESAPKINTSANA